MYIESSYKQLLFGVSQQDYKDRLDGQNEEQVNMSSDLTFNLRRRAPVQFLGFLPQNLVPNEAQLARYETTVDGARVVVLVQAADGTVVVLQEGGTVLHTEVVPYLVAPSRKSVRFATLGDKVYIANTAVQPKEVPAPEQTSYPDPKRSGYFYVLNGQFGREFHLTVTKLDTGNSYSVLYETPDGGAVGDAALTTPEYIAEKLVELAALDPNIGTAAGVTYTREGPYVYVTSTNFDIAIRSRTGSLYIDTSLSGVIRDIPHLPAVLPALADGFIIGVGERDVLRYYRWAAAKQRWLEDASRDAIVKLEDMPIVLGNTAGTWAVTSPTWEQRAAGDADSNPTPHFVERGITGMASFQGRLVLLANDYVCMSASNTPERWFRTTLENLRSDDPIEIASTAAQASPYTWATAFNKDLILWADRYQSVIPGRAAVTPSNANVAVMNQYEARTDVEPQATGRNLFFAAPRSAGYDGIWEMSPSDIADSQLVANDVTNHIPQYIRGACRFISASTTSNVVVSGFQDDLKELLIHEYFWSGGEKIHHSWHKWVFQWDVLDVWFISDRMYMLFDVGGRVAYAVLDLRVGVGPAARSTGRLDMQTTVTVGPDGLAVVPVGLAGAWDAVVAFRMTAPFQHMSQEAVPTGVADEFRIVGASPGDSYVLGVKYPSYVVPTAPVLRDRDGNAISTQRTQLHKYIITLQNTGEFYYAVSDKYRPAVTVDTSPLKFGSPELGAGIPLVASGQQYVPARVDMPTSRLEIGTSDVYDLNISGLEYGYRYTQRYGRRK